MAEQNKKQNILDKAVDYLDLLIVKIKESIVKLQQTEQYKKSKPYIDRYLGIAKKKAEPILNKIEPYTKSVKRKLSSIKHFIFEKIGLETEEEIIELELSEDNVSSDSFVKEELSETDKKAKQAAIDALAKKKADKIRLLKKIFIVVVFVLMIINIISGIIMFNKKQDERKEIMKKVAKVVKMNINSQLSGSGTLSPKDSYTITSLVEGKVIETFFEEGDKVEKDQLLLTIDSSSAERTITTASASLAQAKDSYLKAKKEYEDMERDYKDNTFKSPFTGYLRTINVKAGDILSNNIEIATVIDSSSMTIKVPFLFTEAAAITVGDTASLLIQENGEILQGKVESVAQEMQTINNGSLVSYVTIVCDNPGGLTENNNASAIIKGIYSVGDAPFEIGTNKKITFTAGNGAEIESMLVAEGAYVKKNDPIFKITDDTIIYVTQSIRNNYLSAQKNLIQAESSFEDSQDKYNEYYITAPISGTVISKDAKVGDKIQNKSNSTNQLAIIYDLSELNFQMDIDELDIVNVKIGQEVSVKADAFGNKRFKGEVTEISLVANNSNGVTNYPVTVTIKETGDLLPGMNVDGYIILKEAKDALVIPSNALQRGNVVYVLNSSETIRKKNYSTEGVSERVRPPEGFTAVAVTTGVTNDDFIQITEGLVEGDEIYVTESSSNQRNFGGFGGGMGGPPMGGGGGRR